MASTVDNIAGAEAIAGAGGRCGKLVVDAMCPPPEPVDRFLHVYSASHPLRAQRDLHKVAEGSTLKQIVDAVDPTGTLRSHFVVHVGGRVVPREYWRYVRPHLHTSVAIRAVPMGGDDKDPLRTILTIVVVVAAAAVGGGAIGSLTATEATIASAAVSVLGRLAIDAIAPPPSPEEQNDGGVDADPRQPSIENARNRPQRYQPIPRIYGTYRFVPPYSVLPFTEVRGNDQYLNLAVCWGYGPLVIDDLRIGDTRIEEYDEVEISHDFGDGNGWTNGELISRDVSEESLAVLLRKSDGYTVRTTEPNVDRISVDITFASGLVEITDQGRKLKRRVMVDVEYAETGTNNWQSASNATTAGSSQVTADAINYSPVFGPGGAGR